jgi:hypothetical protein
MEHFMGLKLDKTRSYGTVYGHPNAAYEQDGKLFKPDGTEYVETLPPADNTLKLPERRDGLR